MFVLRTPFLTLKKTEKKIFVQSYAPKWLLSIGAEYQANSLKCKSGLSGLLIIERSGDPKQFLTRHLT